MYFFFVELLLTLLAKMMMYLKQTHVNFVNLCIVLLLLCIIMISCFSGHLNCGSYLSLIALNRISLIKKAKAGHISFG